jgi:YbbR domain-containing protein
MKLSLDLSEVVDRKREFNLTADMINVPSSLTVSDIIPSKIAVTASERIPWTFPVHIKSHNALPENLSLQKMSVTPAKVRVLIASQADPEKIRIETEPIDLQKILSTTTVDAKLVLPISVSFPDDQMPTAKVLIKVKKKNPPR